MNAHHFRKIRKLAGSAVLALLLASCVSQTPADRIEKNPLLFDSLPVDQKLMVQQGRICNGMSPEAVFLAWGHPNTPPVECQTTGSKTERWVYRAYESVPVMTTGFGFGYGPYGCYGACYPQMDTAFVPYDAAYVEFTDGKVTSWQRRRP